MKRSDFTSITTSDSTLIYLQGYPIGVTEIIKNENNSNKHYTLTMEGCDGTPLTVMRYLNPGSTCRLYGQLRLSVLNNNGVELSNIKFNGVSYTITNETRLSEVKLTFNPKWCVTQRISDLKSLAEEKLCAIECKILHMGPSETFTVTSGYKRTQKQRKEIIVGDKTAAIILNIYEIHFDSLVIETSYKISALKTRLFKNIVSLSAITETKFETIPELVDVSYDTSPLSASLKIILGRLIRLEPDTNDDTSMCPYKATIETSDIEEYSLIVARHTLIDCIELPNSNRNITKDMLSDLIEKQRLINSKIKCIFDINSGLIKQMERQTSFREDEEQIRKINHSFMNAPLKINRSESSLISPQQTTELNDDQNVFDNISSNEITNDE